MFQLPAFSVARRARHQLRPSARTLSRVSPLGLARAPPSLRCVVCVRAALEEGPQRLGHLNKGAQFHSNECSNSPPLPFCAGVDISSIPRARSPLGSSTTRASAASFVRAALEEGPQRSSIGARKKLA